MTDALEILTDRAIEMEMDSLNGHSRVSAGKRLFHSFVNLKLRFVGCIFHPTAAMT